MVINSRAKGIRFERLLANLLTEKTGKKITRNWQAQSAEGGHDLEGMENFAVECKACKTIAVNLWWEQTREQASRSNRIPVLFYKPSQKDWVVVVQLQFILSSFKNLDELASISIDAFITLAKSKKLI